MSCCCDLPNGLAARFSLSSFCSSGSTGSRSLQVFSLGIVDVTLLYSHFFMLKSDCKKPLLLTKYVEWKYSLHFKSDGRYYIWTEQLVLNISKNCPLKYFLAFLRFGVYYLIIMCVCFDFFYIHRLFGVTSLTQTNCSSTWMIIKNPGFRWYHHANPILLLVMYYTLATLIRLWLQEPIVRMTSFSLPVANDCETANRGAKFRKVQGNRQQVQGGTFNLVFSPCVSKNLI